MNQIEKCFLKRILLKKGTIPSNNLPMSSSPKQSSLSLKRETRLKKRNILNRNCEKIIISDYNNDRISNKESPEPVENPAVENSSLENLETNPTKRR